MTERLPVNGARAGAVLVIDGDRFEGGYLAHVLEAYGLPVLGPFQDADEARGAAEALRPRAAVLSLDGLLNGGRGITGLLDRRAIPYLLLVREAAAQDPLDHPVLPRPFAAYQVADWVLDTFAFADAAELATRLTG